MGLHLLKLRTLNDIFFDVAARQDERAMLWRDAEGAWQPISGHQIYQRVVAFSAALERLGIIQGDRIALLAENRWEWAVADFALLAMGAAGVPVYPTLTAEQTCEMLSDSGCRIVVVSTLKQYEKIVSIREHTALEHIIVMDDEELPGALQFHKLIGEAGFANASLQAPPLRDAERDSNFDRRARDVQPGDLAAIIYTSGTTGEPKGVMLTHGNLATNINYSSREYKLDAADSCISFLPLSHITARHLDYLLLARGATLAYCPFFEQLPAAMSSVRPTVFVSVPRVYEKVMHEVTRRSAHSPLKAAMLRAALSIGKRSRATVVAGNRPSSPLWKLADKFVFRKVRQAFGGRVRYFVSGGAPLGLDTAEWFADVGIQLLEGYGMTETSPAITLSSQKAARLGSVGQPLPNIEVLVADDGELLVRGPSVFEGYWQKPEATAAAFMPDPIEPAAALNGSFSRRWFRTGDLARLDADRFLFITGRKKELLKTSGGKTIAPQPVENKLKADNLVAEAIMVGDRRKFACVLIAPNFAALEEWARAQNIPVAPRSGLVGHPEVRAIYQRIVHATNTQLANFEKIKRFHIVADEWTIETGEMTPSMKIKRRVILERYDKEIADLYHDESVAHG